MNVSLTAQILSHLLAAGINSLCTPKYLTEEARLQNSLKQSINYLTTLTVEIEKNAQKYKCADADTRSHRLFIKSSLKYLSFLRAC